jgi:DnaJ-domain-containing protein 1
MLMEDDLEDINQRMLDVLDDMQRLFTRRMNEAAKTIIDPTLQGMLKSMGIDMSQFRGMTSGRTAIDSYRIMGLDRSASDEEVKKRYIELVHVLHPDKSGTPGTGHFFQMVQAAYELIKKERGWQ